MALGAAGATGYLARTHCPEPPSNPGVAPRFVPPEKLTARIISWDVGFKPPTEQEWIALVSKEVADAAAAGIDVLVFPELFAAGLVPYAPQDEREAEFVTRRMNDAVLFISRRGGRKGQVRSDVFD